MIDPIDLSIFKSAFHSIAEEMGAALRRTSFSPNIKERRDYSSAVFDGDGQVIAMGDDMPVHLGSMPMSVRAALDELTLNDGDIAILNDPYDGGTHLPDITLIVPVFLAGANKAAFFVANRAHHADVGGMYPGSMGLCREFYQEGIRIPPVKLYEAGARNEPLLRLILNNVRTPQEREGDLTAQIGACRIGAQRVSDLIQKYGYERVRQIVGGLLDHSEQLMRAELESLPRGRFQRRRFSRRRRNFRSAREDCCHNPHLPARRPHRFRFHGVCSASDREFECSRRHHLLGCLLRAALSVTG